MAHKQNFHTECGREVLLKDYDYAYLFVSKDSEAVLCQKFQQTLEEQLGIHIYGTVSHFRDLFEVIMKESRKRHFR